MPLDFDELARRVSKAIDQQTSRRTLAAGAVAGTVASSFAMPAGAQEATPAPDSTENGPEFLFVQTFVSGSFTPTENSDTQIEVVVAGTPASISAPDFQLTVSGHLGQTIYFSDRPARVFGNVSTPEFLDTLGFTPVNPPNAALVTTSDAGDSVVVIVELFDPVVDDDGDTITYQANILANYEEEALQHVVKHGIATEPPAEFGDGSLFIDDCPSNLFRCHMFEGGILFTGDGDDDDEGWFANSNCWGWSPIGCHPCRDLNALCNEWFADFCEGQSCYAETSSGFAS